jgi:hypothetical protein
MSQEEVQRHYSTNIGNKYPINSQYPDDTVAKDEDDNCDSCSGRVCNCSNYS